MRRIWPFSSSSELSIPATPQLLDTTEAAAALVGECGRQHLQQFACTGAPIIHPITGRVEGVLDISSLSQAWSPLMHTLVKSAAKDISRNLLLDCSQSQHAIFDTYLRVDAKSSRHAVFAFGESIFMANAAAQGLFDAREQHLVREHAAFIVGRRDKASDTLVLPGGRMVRVRGTRILVGSGIAGGSSPAWVRACAELRDALRQGRPSIVLGETGSGKFTLVAEIFHDSFPGARSVSVDAAQLGVRREPGGGRRPPGHLPVEPVPQAQGVRDQELTGFAAQPRRLRR